MIVYIENQQQLTQPTIPPIPKPSSFIVKNRYLMLKMALKNLKIAGGPLLL